MKKRSLLYFLAVGVLSAAPAFADRFNEALSEHEGKAVTTRSLPNGHWFRDADTRHNMGLGPFKESNPASHLRDFDVDGRLAIMNDRSSAGIGDVDSLPVGLTNGDRLEKIDKKGVGRNHPVDVDHNGASSLPPVVVPEPEAATLVVLGVGVLGLLLYRRSTL